MESVAGIKWNGWSGSSGIRNDWLKWDFALNLSNFIQELEQGKTTEESFDSFFTHKFVSWAKKKNDLRKLLTTAEDELSPRKFIVNGSLPLISDNAVKWLALFAHQMWLVRYDVRTNIETALHAVDTAAASYNDINNNVQNYLPGHAVGASGSLLATLKKFREYIGEISKCISSLPHNIRI